MHSVLGESSFAQGLQEPNSISKTPPKQDPRKARAGWTDGLLSAGASQLLLDEPELKEHTSAQSSVVEEGAVGFCLLDRRCQIAEARAPTC